MPSWPLSLCPGAMEDTCEDCCRIGAHRGKLMRSCRDCSVDMVIERELEMTDVATAIGYPIDASGCRIPHAANLTVS